MEEKEFQEKVQGKGALASNATPSPNQSPPTARRFVARFLRGGIERFSPSVKGLSASAHSAQNAILSSEMTSSKSASSSFETPQLAQLLAVENQDQVESSGKILAQEIPKIRGFLVSYDGETSGDVIALRSGQWIVSSEHSLGSKNFVLIDDPSISPVHALINISDDGCVSVSDRLSEYGTIIKRQSGLEELVKFKAITIQHGDLIKFGKRSFHLCLVQ